MSDVQLEAGPRRTPFDRRNFNEQLINCQRFACKSFPYGVAPAQNAGQQGCQIAPILLGAAAVNTAPWVPFPVTMLSPAPQITIFNPSNANGNPYNITLATDCAAPNVTYISDRGFGLQYTSNAAAALGNVVGYHWIATNELF